VSANCLSKRAVRERAILFARAGHLHRSPILAPTDDGTLEIEISFHLGDDAVFKAIRE
jgi:hypothetical protein